MSHDAINSWVSKAKKSASASAGTSSAVQVIRRETVQTTGSLIMEIAEKIRPHLLKMFTGVRDDEGMLLQPAHVRGIALNVAQKLVKDQEK